MLHIYVIYVIYICYVVFIYNIYNICVTYTYMFIYKVKNWFTVV